MSNIQDEVAQAREPAYKDTGGRSSESAAWDAAKELEAEASPQPKSKSAFEQYCDDNPGASECRVYEE